MPRRLQKITRWHRLRASYLPIWSLLCAVSLPDFARLILHRELLLLDFDKAKDVTDASVYLLNGHCHAIGADFWTFQVNGRRSAIVHHFHDSYFDRQYTAWGSFLDHVPFVDWRLWIQSVAWGQPKGLQSHTNFLHLFLSPYVPSCLQQAFQHWNVQSIGDSATWLYQTTTPLQQTIYGHNSGTFIHSQSLWYDIYIRGILGQPALNDHVWNRAHGTVTSYTSCDWDVQSRP